MGGGEKRRKRLRPQDKELMRERKDRRDGPDDDCWCRELEPNALRLCCASDRWSLGADRPSLAANDDNLVLPEAGDCGERVYFIFA